MSGTRSLCQFLISSPPSPPATSVTCLLSSSSLPCSYSSINSQRRSCCHPRHAGLSVVRCEVRDGGVEMGTSNLVTSGHLRHVESMSTLPSGAGKISQLNAVILGESLALEEHDLVFPSTEFSKQALVSSPEKYLEMYRSSICNSTGFWSDVPSECHWKEKWDSAKVFSENLDVRKGTVKNKENSDVELLLINFFLYGGGGRKRGRTFRSREIR